MIKFRLIFDWYLDDFFDKVKIYEAGHIFLPSEDGNYIIENPINGGKTKMDIEQMRNAKDGSVFMFEEIDEQEINMTMYGYLKMMIKMLHYFICRQTAEYGI